MLKLLVNPLVIVVHYANLLLNTLLIVVHHAELTGNTLVIFVHHAELTGNMPGIAVNHAELTDKHACECFPSCWFYCKPLSVIAVNHLNIWKTCLWSLHYAELTGKRVRDRRPNILQKIRVFVHPAEYTEKHVCDCSVSIMQNVLGNTLVIITFMPNILENMLLIVVYHAEH